MIPIILLSATISPYMKLNFAKIVGLRKPYTHISLPLDRPNIFYSVKDQQYLSCDFKQLESSLLSAECALHIPKTLIFCNYKDTVYNILHLWKVASTADKGIGFRCMYHASKNKCKYIIDTGVKDQNCGCNQTFWDGSFRDRHQLSLYYMHECMPQGCCSVQPVV